MASAPHIPVANLVLREQGGRVYYEAKFRYAGEQVWRRLGPAWLELDPDAPAGSPREQRYRPRRGRVAEGYLDERAAHVHAAAIVGTHVEQMQNAARLAEER